ncbi:hypothetical protein BJX99DRAFT_228280, partial [Aspergillus californicus]
MGIDLDRPSRFRAVFVAYMLRTESDFIKAQSSSRLIGVDRCICGYMAKFKSKFDRSCRVCLCFFLSLSLFSLSPTPSL